jgi:hypothetical protein
VNFKAVQQEQLMLNKAWFKGAYMLPLLTSASMKKKERKQIQVKLVSRTIEVNVGTIK